MNKIWLGLSSKAGAGKSTIRKALVKDYGFLHFTFAKRLKEICKELFPELIIQDKNTYRWVLQKFGTEYCRQIKNNVWVDIVAKQIERHKDYPKIIVDDVRFFNEYLALQRFGFKMIRVVRSDFLREAAGYNVKDRHASECQLDDLPAKWWDLILYCDWEYPFKEAVQEVVSHFGVK